MQIYSKKLHEIFNEGFLCIFILNSKMVKLVVTKPEIKIEQRKLRSWNVTNVFMCNFAILIF